MRKKIIAQVVEVACKFGANIPPNIVIKLRSSTPRDGFAPDPNYGDYVETDEHAQQRAGGVATVNYPGINRLPATQ